jgi:GntR family transcriptional regulator
MQLGRSLAEAIRSGWWHPNEALPSERVISEQLGVSRVTARKAFDVLIAEGLICRRQGSGTFITPRTEQPLTRLSSFTELITQRGFRPSSVLLAFDVGLPNYEELVTLGFSPSTAVLRLKRQRFADGVAMAIEQTTLPASITASPEEIGDSLYAFLDRRGQTVTRALQHIRAVNASPETASLLDVPVGDAMLFVSRVGYTASGTAIELTHSWCRSDYYDFVAELRR